MMMSPSSMASASWPMTASVALPAWTMMRARRGRSKEATNSSIVADGTKLPVEPNSSMKASVLDVVRL